MAAKAYDVAAYCLKGRKAQLNFPDEVHRLPPLPSACTARDIQAAAAKAAHMMMASAAAPPETSISPDDAADDFWREIELPELLLLHGGGSSRWWTSDLPPWPEPDLPPQHPFTTAACL
ncbi:ethylene-responsive transcription factor ERF023-like [Cajanus cajan]|uniref:ethylene-responsive transcription factor ERF023-like n=1 Tax=Cajanus cajan TaxID=3821 RepID=UPI0010FB5B33|nr:ethylene-responsive transcription factor ERF023-like [Cajanus cajan]